MAGDKFETEARDYVRLSELSPQKTLCPMASDRGFRICANEPVWNWVSGEVSDVVSAAGDALNINIESRMLITPGRNFRATHNGRANFAFTAVAHSLYSDQI